LEASKEAELNESVVLEASVRSLALAQASAEQAPTCLSRWLRAQL
jgi:hypothetical protein